MLTHTTWTNMSEAHLRLDLRAQNPLYQRAGSTTARFDDNRCPYQIRIRQEAAMTEAERRRAAILRREKYLVIPDATYERAQRETEKDRDQPILRPAPPSWAHVQMRMLPGVITPRPVTRAPIERKSEFNRQTITDPQKDHEVPRQQRRRFRHDVRRRRNRDR